jgi:hypothetical protein
VSYAGWERATHLDDLHGQVAREHFVQRHGLLDKQLHVFVDPVGLASLIPLDVLIRHTSAAVARASKISYLESSDVCAQPVTHDRNELGVNLVLVLLVVLGSTSVAEGA